MSKKYRNKSWLEKQYKDKNRDSRDIAEECGVTRHTINNWVRKYDIKREYEIKSNLLDMYWSDGMTLKDIADKFGVSQTPITNLFEEHGIETRNHKNKFVNKDRVGKSCASYRIGESGYPEVYSWNNDRKQHDMVRIHQLIAIANGADPHNIFDGKGNTSIHHKNEFKIDNRPTNLEVRDMSDHARYHALKQGLGGYVE